MVKVYFERKNFAKLVAIFEEEQDYKEIFTELEILAYSQGFEKVTESIEEHLNLYNIVNNRN
jgi:hypothetical protein